MIDFDYSQHIFRSPKFRSVVEEAIDFFNTSPVREFPPKTEFVGAGVYALYYLGKNDVYIELSKSNAVDCVNPIYVGKAVPRGWRTGRIREISNSGVLRGRLKEHARSIDQVDNLKLHDFKCKFMILNDIESDLVIPVEAELIRRYQPVWNTVVDGFGNHDPGSGRYNQAPSEWDTLHPGRSWTKRLMGSAPDLNDIIRKTRTHLQSLGLS